MDTKLQIFSSRKPFFRKLVKFNGKELELKKNQQWICIQVESGTELEVVATCLNERISFFVPLILTSKSILTPLWTNYIFCRLSQKNRLDFKYRKSIVRLLEPPDEIELINHLRQFSAINTSKAPFQKDQVVRVKTGALAGLAAKIDEVDYENASLKISLKILGRVLSFRRSFDEVELDLQKGSRITVTPLEKSTTVKKSERGVRKITTARESPLQESVVKALNIQIDEINNEYIKYLEKHPHLLYSIEPRRFEILIAELFRDMGYEIELTPESHDGGRDILAAFNLPHGKILTLVECKRYSQHNKIGVEILRSFLYVLDRKDNASCGVIATTSYFSSESLAMENEHKWRLGLKDFNGVRDWLNKYGTWRRDNSAGLWLPDSC